jgi:hypothetical protein
LLRPAPIVVWWAFSATGVTSVFGKRNWAERVGLSPISRSVRRSSRSRLICGDCGAGVQRAYDEVLVIACAELGVDTTLSETPAGQQRDLERLRVEFMLGECGLFL